MPVLTLAQAEAALAAWYAADLAVADGQSYTMGTRQLTKVDAAEITEKIKFYERMVNRKTRGGPSVRGIVPLS